MYFIRQIYQGFPRIPLYLFIFLSVATWILSAFGPFLCYNATDSMPKGIYVLLAAKDFRRGDIVLFPPPGQIAALCQTRRYVDDKTLFLKYVAALEGDRYYKKAQDFYIESRMIGRISSADRQGRELPQLGEGFKIVSPGYFLPVSFAERSFDARYYGEVPLSAVQYKAVPLLVY